MRIPRFLFAAWFAVLLAAPPASLPMRADAKVPARSKVEDVLRILRHKPNPTKKDLAGVGEGTVDVLVNLAGGKSVETGVRVRAARLLGRFGGRQAEAVLTSLVFDPHQDAKVRCAAMVGLARAKGMDAVGDLAPFLRDDNPEIRKGAAVALAEAGGDKALQVLLNALEHEGSLDVKRAIDEAVHGMRDE